MSKIEEIHRRLCEQEKKLALAESCTGGYFSSLFTAMPDASLYFLGAIISYSNELKADLLYVSKETLRIHGAVSRETANEMLLGLMKRTGADFGIANTGIAGPSGATRERPIGTVFIAMGAKGKKPHVIECHFDGNRKQIIQQTCDRALADFIVLIEPVIAT